MANKASTYSPHLRAPWDGTPVIRVQVYRKASSAGGDMKYYRLPVPKDLGGADEPDMQFGFRQTVTKGTSSDRGYTVQTGPTDDFEVVSAKVNQTRFWSCSSATFTLACPFTRWTAPKLPPVRCEDVVTVELGYAPSLRVKLANPNVWFKRVFYGIVDTVKEHAGSGSNSDGVSFTVTCRDTLRYLVDNKVRGAYLKVQGKDRDDPTNRAWAVVDLLWMGAQIDAIQWEKTTDASARVKAGTVDQKGNVVGRGFEATRKAADTDIFALDDKGFKKPLTTGTGVVMPADIGPNNCFITVGSIEYSERRDALPTTADGSSHAGGPQGIPIMDRFPLDLIKHFSLVETNPRELFADPVNGKVHWVFRRTDMRRLLDPKTSALRQYFFRFPEDRANILSYTNEWTTAGTVSHFTITNGQAHNGTSVVTERYVESPMAQLRDPHREGMGKDHDEYLRIFTRQRFVYDDTLTDQDELSVLANALFTIWGKDIQTGMLQVIGDPTLDVGEAIQIFNTSLFGRRLVRQNMNDPNSPWEQSGPTGIFRVEGVQHLYGSGGAQHGYTSVIIFNSIDPPAKQIHTRDDLRGIKYLKIPE